MNAKFVSMDAKANPCVRSEHALPHEVNGKKYPQKTSESVCGEREKF